MAVAPGAAGQPDTVAVTEFVEGIAEVIGTVTVVWMEPDESGVT